MPRVMILLEGKVTMDLKKPTYHHAATASWAIFLGFAILRTAGKSSLTTSNPNDAMIIALTVIIVGLVFYAFGVCCALYALSGMKKVGRNEIVIPAVLGLSLNGIGILLCVAALVGIRLF